MSSVTPNSVGTDFSSKLESLADKLSLVLPSNILLPCLLAIYLPDITSLYASNFLQTPEPWPSCPASRPSPQDSGPDTGEGGAPCTPSGCSDRRRDAAARTLQARWKAYKHKVSPGGTLAGYAARGPDHATLPGAPATWSFSSHHVSSVGDMQTPLEVQRTCRPM